MVNTIREGFTEFNEVLANTLKGTNQPQQGNINQVQNKPLNQIQQIRAQVHQAQPLPHMLYTQNFPQLILPTNPYKLVQHIYNKQKETNPVKDDSKHVINAADDDKNEHINVQKNHTPKGGPGEKNK